MPTYEEVLNLAQRLAREEQVRLIQALKVAHQSIEVENSEEVISPEEIAESETAWQDYLEGRDLGLSPEALKLKLFGEIG